MINQRLEQKLIQKLSPQQIQLMKLLQIPTIALEQRIKQEIEENPALEEAAEEENIVDESQDNEEENRLDEGDEEDESSDEKLEEDKRDDVDIDDFFEDDDEIPEYKLNINNTGPDDDLKQTVFVSDTSFQDYLISQLGLRPVTEKQKLIGEIIIGNIDDSGYLRREPSAITDDIAFSFNVDVSAAEVEEVLEIIKQFDPPGVGAKDLRECLLIQLLHNDQQTESVKLATKIVGSFFEELTRKHYDKILKKTETTEKELKEALDEIAKLNPKPGNTMSEVTKNNPVILPDFFINNIDGKPELTINSRNAPELRVSRTFQEMLSTYSGPDKKKNGSKEALIFIKQKIESAKWFIEAIKQRQNTLYITMEAIMNFQKDYFISGDETLIKPMILKDIADIVNMDISTISRVANSKYVQTSFGTFLLKKLFSESLQTESGEEVSTREVKKILSDCISNENKHKPLTDDQLAKILNEKGYNIARRTVAKYREQLNIHVARLRKEL